MNTKLDSIKNLIETDQFFIPPSASLLLLLDNLIKDHSPKNNYYEKLFISNYQDLLHKELRRKDLNCAFFGGSTENIFVLNNVPDYYISLQQKKELNKVLESRILFLNDYVSSKNQYKNMYYDTISGLSGILYFLTTNQMYFSNEIITKIITTLNIRHKDDFNKLILTGEDYSYLDNGFAHGLSGITFSLSNAYISGIKHKNIQLSIKRLVYYFMDNVKIDNNIPYWDMVTLTSTNKKETNNKYNLYSWCYGSLGILNSLHCASKALNDNLLQKWIEKSIYNTLKKTTYAIKDLSENICHGKSGILCFLNNYKYLFSEQEFLHLSDLLVNSLSSKLDMNMDSSLLNNDIGVALSILSIKSNSLLNKKILMSCD